MYQYKPAMRDRIPTEYAGRVVQENDLRVGQQIKLNHKDCPAGQDTKQRLYVKRVSENGYLFYCHHCGQSCRYHLAGGAGNMARHLNQGAAGGHGHTEQQHSPDSNRPQRAGGQGDTRIREFTEWPAQAQQWLRQYGITRQEVQEHGIYYDGNGIAFPVLGDDGEQHGLVVRKKLCGTIKHWRGAKTLTHVFRGSGNLLYKVCTGHNCLCIVEDCVSAIKMGRHCDCVALLGTNYNALPLNMVKGYDKVIIFFDNDNGVVRDKQEDLRNKLALVCTNVVLYRGNKDPKECSDDELLQIVNCQNGNCVVKS